MTGEVPDVLPEGTRLGTFRIIKYLGEGKAGRAYLATPCETRGALRPGDLVALKVYKDEILREPNEAERIQREFRVGSEEPHPRLVRVFDIELEAEPPYLVMEYVDGTPLDRWIRMFHHVPADLALRIIQQVVDALSHLHERGLIHRDLKPENIMITSQFDVKVMDLGVVRTDSDTRLTPAGEHLGTTRNSSPELLLGQDIDPRTDLYSLGTVIYALLHGKQVFADVTHSKQLADLVVRSDPEFDPDIGTGDPLAASLRDLALRLLSKKADDRPPSAEDVAAQLSDLATLLGEDSFDALHGYVATALTGLDADAKEAVDFAALKIAEVAKSFRVYVYQPRRATDPALNADVTPASVYLLDRERVLGADVLFILANKPSFGVGQELEIAAMHGIPVVLISREGTTISRMMKGSFANILGEITYNGPEDLEGKLRGLLGTVIKELREWRRRTSHRIDGVGRRFASAREHAGYASAREFAARAKVSAGLVEALERGDYENIGLQLLGILAAEVNETVASLLGEGVAAAPRLAIDANLARLEEFAREMQLPASEYLDLRDDYAGQLAASGEPLRFTKDDWMKRRQALTARHFRDAEAGRPQQPHSPNEAPQGRLPL